jgi:hypothetical protein
VYNRIRGKVYNFFGCIFLFLMNFGGSASAIKGDNPSYSVQPDPEESVHLGEKY